MTDKKTLGKYHSAHLLAPELQNPDVLTTLYSDHGMNREELQAMQDMMLLQADKDELQPDRKWTAPADGDQPAVDLYAYYPKSKQRGEKLPVVYYTHGGGMVIGHARIYSPMFFALAEQTGAVVVSVEYRVALEAPFPAANEDVYHGLKYLVTHAGELGLDAQRIVLMGESGGGGLTASVAFMIRDRKEFSVCGQVLIVPMIDCRTGSEASPYKNEYNGEFVWNRFTNQTAWEIQRGGQDIPQEQMAYFAPALASDFSRLMPTYIITGGLDLFAAENLDFARNLMQAGVPVELHMQQGVYHGFDQVNPDIPQTREFVRMRTEGAVRLFSGK